MFDSVYFDQIYFDGRSLIQKAIGGVLSFAGSVIKATSKAILGGNLAFAGSLIKTTSKAICGAVSFVGGIIWAAGRRLKMKLFKRPYYDMAVEVKPYRNISTETREVKP